MPIVSHCPSLSPPADFCSTCGAAPLRVCLRKRASQRIDELSDCLLPTMFYKYYVVSCHIMLLLAEPHSRTFLFAPHLVPWLPGATKAEAAIKAAVPVAAPAILDMAGIMAPRQDDFFQGLRFKALNLKI